MLQPDKYHLDFALNYPNLVRVSNDIEYRKNLLRFSKYLFLHTFEHFAKTHAKCTLQRSS